MAVAILDHEPLADDLLRDRLARGWLPRATATRDGDVIHGHAAGCRIAGGAA